MVLLRGEEVRSRKSPGDGGWKIRLEAILPFPFPVLETAYGKVNSAMRKTHTEIENVWRSDSSPAVG